MSTYNSRTYNGDDYSGGTVTIAAPGSPAISVGTAATGISQIQWSPVNQAVGYKVESSPDNTTWTVIATNWPSLFYTKTSFGTFYRVLATGQGGDSAPSNVVQITTVQPYMDGYLYGYNNTGAVKTSSRDGYLYGYEYVAANPGASISSSETITFTIAAATLHPRVSMSGPAVSITFTWAAAQLSSGATLASHAFINFITTSTVNNLRALPKGAVVTRMGHVGDGRI
jgi:hypothetical protein